MASDGGRRGLWAAVKRAWVHLGLWGLVVCYALAGAAVFQALEGSNLLPPEVLDDSWLRELEAHLGSLRPEEQRRRLGVAKRVLEEWDAAMAQGVPLGEVVSEQALATAEGRAPAWHWAFPSALLFAFTTITTIGYGNLTPETTAGRAFAVFFALFGIPLTMLAIADLGKFAVEAVEGLVGRLRSLGRSKRPPSPAPSDGEGGGCGRGVGLAAAFGGFVLVSAALLPLWEELSFAEAAYFVFVTVTTVGYGDVVPRRTEWLWLSLCLITLGLALTTVCVEAASGIFKKLHYFGARLSNVRSAVIWFGGRQLSVGKLVLAIGKKWGVPSEDMDRLDLDRLVERAADGAESEGPTRDPSPSPPPLPRLSLPIGPSAFRSLLSKDGDVHSLDYADEESEHSTASTVTQTRA